MTFVIQLATKAQKSLNFVFYHFPGTLLMFLNEMEPKSDYCMWDIIFEAENISSNNTCPLKGKICSLLECMCWMRSLLIFGQTNQNLVRCCFSVSFQIRKDVVIFSGWKTSEKEAKSPFSCHNKCKIWLQLLGYCAQASFEQRYCFVTASYGICSLCREMLH